MADIAEAFFNVRNNARDTGWDKDVIASGVLGVFAIYSKRYIPLTPFPARTTVPSGLRVTPLP
jgi:hypothetical protein